MRPAAGAMQELARPASVSPRSVRPGGRRHRRCGAALPADPAPLFRLLVALPDAPKIAIALLLIAPACLLHGDAFPLGLSRVSAWAPGLAPCAWGINGCASVLSAILATLLAMNVPSAIFAAGCCVGGSVVALSLLPDRHKILRASFLPPSVASWRASRHFRA